MEQSIISVWRAGSNFFNLTPRNTDGKFPKKAVAMRLHIVFKVAKTMAPSVIFIDEVEKIFLSDKKKLKEFASAEPYNRIKKDLAKVRTVPAHPFAVMQHLLACGTPFSFVNNSSWLLVWCRR